MGETTAIEWCDATLNLWWGCTKVSDGCKHCYAETLTNRYGRNNWGPSGTRQEVKSWRQTIAKVGKRAKVENRRLRVFVQSMSDTFEGPDTMGGVDSENWKTTQRLKTELEYATLDYPELDFLVLTKRPENVLPRWGASFFGCRPNVWIGTSVEDQSTADERIPHLLAIPATVRFLSCEPLLGPIDLRNWLEPYENYPRDANGEFLGYSNFVQPNDIHWVIVGGESGPKARPMHPDWARSLRDQCTAADVPFLFKQWGEWWPPNIANAVVSKPFVRKAISIRDDGMVSEGSENCAPVGGYGWASMWNVGKHRAGRVLDGRTWDEFPSIEKIEEAE